MMQDALDKMLLNYAAGMLSAEESLLVAALSALDPGARRRVARYEALGGCVLEDEAPAAVGCLEAVLKKIDTCCDVEQCPPPSLPEPLARLLAGCTRDDQACWGRARGGIARIELRITPSPRARLTLMRVAPNTAVPAHSHGGTEITLVLDGGYSDAFGEYRRGDVSIVADAHVVHSPRSGPNGCLSLVYCDGPLRFTNPLYFLIGLLR